MREQNKYLVYQDEMGKHGYASESFYEGNKEILKDLFIVGIKLSEDSAKSISKELNKLR